ncbi:MAG: HAMP domain-containing protein, partial [Candidatus Eisenbacteria bacterium]|nr:HAMP domain-containing protein [Candidatus Eisenbacteria bacterium]
SIGGRAVARAGAVMDSIDRAIYMRIELLRTYAGDIGEEPALVRSNQQFDAMEDAAAYIVEQDRAWVAAGTGQTTPFMDGLIRCDLSERVRRGVERKDFYRAKRGHEVFSEVFVTNRYGANVAQSQRTSDYYQADEGWWQEAKKRGLYVTDVQYDESAGVYSIDVCVRVDDSEGRFFGVLKAVVNVEEVIDVLRQEQATGTAELRLLTADSRLIYATKEQDSFVPLSKHLPLQRKEAEAAGDLDYFVADGEAPGEGQKLLAYARSDGFGEYEGLGWIQVVEYKTEDIFAPIAKLRNGISAISLTIGVLAVVLALFVSRSISRPIRRLADAATRIGGGDLDARVQVHSKDEVGDLAVTFNRMAENLRASYASRDELEREVAERHRAERQLQRYAGELERSNEDVRQFAYIVSHDLRAPLVNLKGFASELRAALGVLAVAIEGMLPQLAEERREGVMQACREDVPEALSFIESSVTRMDQLITAVLTLSRLGRRDLQFEPVNVEEIVRATLDGLSHQVEERGVSVAVDPLPEVVADRTSMEQIMGNLLANAVNYLAPGRPGEIHIGGESTQDETTFRVRDNGRGIAAADMGKIFALFRRAGKQDVPGEGMGLAYVQTMVSRHGGRVWCESEEGTGTTFSFTISNHLTKGGTHA